MAALTFFLVGGLGGSGKSAALQSAQATLANLVTAARLKAMSSGRSARVLVHVDARSTAEPRRYLRYLALQVQSPSGWQLVGDAYLPEGVFVVPGNFSSLPAGLFAANGSLSWTRSDGSALRSTVLRSSQIFSEQIGGGAREQWAGVGFAPTGATMQSGDLILAVGKNRTPGSYGPGDSPIELENPDQVRGLTLSAYGVPTLVNDRTSF
jgi:hypothetical protein